MPTRETHNYAVLDVFLGDTDRMHVSSADAWQSFGYDLDGKITTASSTDVCTRVAGAAMQVQDDGSGGIDNSWGANIMPIIVAGNTGGPVSTPWPGDLSAGWWGTQMFDFVGFDDSLGNTTSATGLTGLTLAGAAYPSGTPAWDLTTNWPVAPGSLVGCTPTGGCPPGTNPITSVRVTFPRAYQNAGTFVSGSLVPISLPIQFGGAAMTVNIQSAIVTFDPAMPGSVTNGTIAGVISTQDFIASQRQIAGNISTSLCAGSAFESVATQIEQASDIVLTGTMVSNPVGTPCNAISIGLGFNATEIAAPSVIAPPAPAQPNYCGDGG